MLRRGEVMDPQKRNQEDKVEMGERGGVTIFHAGGDLPTISGWMTEIVNRLCEI